MAADEFRPSCHHADVAGRRLSLAVRVTPGSVASLFLAGVTLGWLDQLTEAWGEELIGVVAGGGIGAAHVMQERRGPWARRGKW